MEGRINEVKLDCTLRFWVDHMLRVV